MRAQTRDRALTKLHECTNSFSKSRIALTLLHCHTPVVVHISPQTGCKTTHPSEGSLQ